MPPAPLIDARRASLPESPVLSTNPPLDAGCAIGGGGSGAAAFCGCVRNEGGGGGGAAAFCGCVMNGGGGGAGAAA